MNLKNTIRNIFSIAISVLFLATTPTNSLAAPAKKTQKTATVKKNTTKKTAKKSTTPAKKATSKKSTSNNQKAKNTKKTATKSNSKQKNSKQKNSKAKNSKSANTSKKSNDKAQTQTKLPAKDPDLLGNKIREIQEQEQIKTARRSANTDNVSTSKQHADDLVMNAMSLLGVSYRFGGSSPVKGMDCSGFIQYIFRQALSVDLPRTSAEMATVGRAVEKSQLQPGDLVFFARNGKRINHVGMYIGNNKFIHAPRTGKDIEIQNLDKPYYTKSYAGARRINPNSRSIKLAN
ncbi:MAG: C40 family peptidase [Neisseriaceae bacterium]|nr:C40 family peptidase [Neisseriaceae bacterium]